MTLANALVYYTICISARVDVTATSLTMRSLAPVSLGVGKADFDEHDGLEVALADWSTDMASMPPGAPMEYEMFFESMLELAHVWTAGANSEQQLLFLVQLFKRITGEGPLISLCAAMMTASILFLPLYFGF
eukprot:SAG31_NODE_6363_length_2042_cov_20.687597_2_plen_132_part_00